MSSTPHDRSGMPSGQDGARDDLREWRWRSYLDHLEDLGYDLGTGQRANEPVAVGPGTTTPSASRSSAVR
jgi:hypothetical protein